MILNILLIFLGVILSTVVIGVVTYFVAKKIIELRELSTITTSNESFAELLDILIVIINSEFDQYEKEIFFLKGSLTNSNFNNFYDDICNKVIDAVSEDLYLQLERYVTREYIIAIIARRVKEYLREKIHPTE